MVGNDALGTAHVFCTWVVHFYHQVCLLGGSVVLREMLHGDSCSDADGNDGGLGPESYSTLA